MPIGFPFKLDDEQLARGRENCLCVRAGMPLARSGWLPLSERGSQPDGSLVTASGVTRGGLGPR